MIPNVRERRRFPAAAPPRLGRRARLRLSRRRDQRDHRRVPAGRRTTPSSSRCGTRRWRRSWPAATRSSPGEVGVCLATSGPGAIHLLNGLYDAKLDHQPVVAIVGQQARSALGGSYQQEVDLVSLFKDVAHEFVEMATEPAQIRHLVDRAVRIALDQRTVTCIIVPNDLAVDGRRRGAGPRARDDPLVDRLLAPRSSCRPADDLQRAADILNAGEKVAMLVGAGALGAADEVVEVAETARRGRREGAARQGRRARRPAVRDRLDRPAGDAAELGPDDGLRHAADGRLELPVLGVPARGGQGARRADRPRRAHDRHPLPDGGPARRRRGGDAARRCSRCSSARPTGRGARRSRRASPRGGS